MSSILAFKLNSYNGGINQAANEGSYSRYEKQKVQILREMFALRYVDTLQKTVVLLPQDIHVHHFVISSLITVNGLSGIVGL